MKSRSECIEYFNKEVEKLRRKIQKLYLENKISECVRNLIIEYMSIYKEKTATELTNEVDERVAEGAVYLALFTYNENIIILLVTLMEIDKIKIPDNAADMKREDHFNLALSTILWSKVEELIMKGAIRKLYLNEMAAILDRPINLSDYPVEYFEKEAKQIMTCEMSKIKKYINHMKSKNN